MRLRKYRYCWLHANKLILNALTSRALTISKKKNRQQAQNLRITIDSCEISVVDFFKHFGIYLDNKVTYRPHISYLHSKLSRSFGIRVCEPESRFRKSWDLVTFLISRFPVFQIKIPGFVR